MEDMGSVFFIVAIVGVIGVFAYFGYLQAKKRREAFRLLAERLGLQFSEGKDKRGIPREYKFLDQLREGEKRYAFNIMRGDYRDHPVCVFDYHYETYSTDGKGNRQTHHHHFSYFILTQDLSFAELRIYPETFLSTIGQALGYDDIDFESVEFSKAFTVRSKDKKRAYDICHTGMMEYLLDNRELKLEFEGNAVAMGFDRRLKPEQVEGRLNQLIEIRELFPEYLYRD